MAVLGAFIKNREFHEHIAPQNFIYGLQSKPTKAAKAKHGHKRRHCSPEHNPWYEVEDCKGIHNIPQV